MAQKASVTRAELIEALNGDLAREYQAVIAYITYSQVIKGAEYMNIADQLKLHASQELAHALLIAQQIDYLGGTPTVTPKPVKSSKDAKVMLHADLDNEVETIQHYRTRIRQADSLGEFAMSEILRRIVTEEQDHAIDLAMALGIDVPVIPSGE